MKLSQYRIGTRCIAISLLFTFLTGCSYFSKPAFLTIRDKEYLKAQSTPPLRIPPGVSSSAFNNYYPVPYRSYPTRTIPVKLDPPGLYT